MEPQGSCQSGRGRSSLLVAWRKTSWVPVLGRLVLNSVSECGGKGLPRSLCPHNFLLFSVPRTVISDLESLAFNIYRRMEVAVFFFFTSL